MIWLIPMAGRGARTKALGEFKPFIEIKSQKILSWIICSIKNKVSPKDTFVFTTTKYFIEKFKVDSEIKKILQNHKLNNDFKIFTCPGTPPGPSASIYLAKSILDTTEAATIVNDDQYVDFKFPKEIVPKNIYVTISADFDNKYGYLKIKDGVICSVAEKNNVSNLAVAGVYIFPQGKEIIYAIEKQFADKFALNGEYFFTPALNYLLKEKYQINPIPVKAYYDLGNLDGIEHFASTPIVESLSITLTQPTSEENSKKMKTSLTSAPECTKIHRETQSIFLTPADSQKSLFA